MMRMWMQTRTTHTHTHQCQRTTLLIVRAMCVCCNFRFIFIPCNFYRFFSSSCKTFFRCLFFIYIFKHFFCYPNQKYCWAKCWLAVQDRVCVFNVFVRVCKMWVYGMEKNQRRKYTKEATKTHIDSSYLRTVIMNWWLFLSFYSFKSRSDLKWSENRFFRLLPVICVSLVFFFFSRIESVVVVLRCCCCRCRRGHCRTCANVSLAKETTK